MKNKILSLVLAVVLIAVQLAIPVAVSADEIPEPVFTLDLSEYTTETQTIKNGVTDSATGISAINKEVTDTETGEVTTYKPTIKEYISGNGDSVQAFQTATEGATGSTLGAIAIDAETVNGLLGANGDKAMTVTFWAKSYRNHYGSRFNYAADGDGGGSINTFNMSSTYDEVAIAGGKGKPSVGTNTHDTWRFYAISKEWTESETTPGSGTWSYTVLFGNTAKTGTTAEIAYTDPSAMEMFIGARGTNLTAAGAYPFQGEIAGFNVYDSALTQSQLETLRAAQNYTVLIAESDMEYADTFTQTAVTDGAVKNVSTTGGTFVIEFNSFIDKDTLSGITLTDKDGNAPEGFVITRYGAKAFVSYSALEDGKDYTLRITDELKSMNDISATPAAMTLKASSAHAPVFSMDLSSYDTTDKIVKNGAMTTPSNEGITVYTNTDVAPLLKKYYGADGSEVRALAISDTENNQLGVVDISAAKIAELLGNGGDEMTITFWSKKYSSKYGSLFNYGTGTADNTATMRSFTSSSDEMVALPLVHSPSKYSKPAANDTWVFHAISRKWIPSSTQDGMGSWRYNVIVGDNASGDLLSGTYAHASTENMRFTIGGRVSDAGVLYTYCHKGEIAGFNIYNTERSAAELQAIKANEAVVYGNMTAEADMPQTFALAEDMDEIEISPYAGSIELEFDNVVKAETVQAGIKLYDSNGNEIKTVAVPSGKTAKITFADLKEGKTYRLIIDENLKSANNIAFPERKSITVNTDASVAELTFGDDAENRPTDEIFKFISSGTEEDLSDFEVMEEEGVKFIRQTMKREAGNSDSWVIYDFGEAQTNSFVIDLKLRCTNGATKAFSRGLYFNKNTSGATTAHNMNASNFGNPVLDELGFANMRYTFDYLGDNQWQVTKYDRNIDGLFKGGNAASVSTYTVSGGLKSVGAGLWLYADDKDNTYTDIAEFKIYRKSNWAPIVTLTKDEKAVWSVNASGEYTVTMEPRGMATGKYNSNSEDMYAYFVVYETNSNGITLPVHVVGGLMNEDDTFTGSFTLEKQAGCKYTAKCFMWQDDMVPLIETIDYK